VPTVLVGCQVVATDGNAVALSPGGENMTLPVSVEDVYATLSPPVLPDVLVNVLVECAPTAERQAEWQIGIYGALVKAWEQSVERHAAVVAERRDHGHRSPLAFREIERRALKHRCTRLLIERAAAMVGAGPPASPPTPWQVDQPRLHLFLDQSLEWAEMTYSFLPDEPAGTGGDQGPEGADPAFGAFLHADQARVLVPVRPDRVLAFLYFFASGMIWDGPDRLVAVNPDDVHVADDLKRTARRREPERIVGRPWEIVVPTAMQILDGADRGVHGIQLPAPAAGEAA
jgi:hypothetical protein